MTSFDEHLSLSSPQVPAPTPELDAELARVVAEAERLASRPQSRRNGRYVIGGLVVLGTLGAGGAAAAAGILPWFDDAPSHGVVTTSAGARCNLTFGIKQVHDPAAPVDDAVRAEVTTAAVKFLRDLDVSALSVAQATHGAAPRPTVDSEAGPSLTVDEYEVEAVYYLVGQRLDARLAKQHLPSSSVSLSLATSCDRDDQ